MPQTRRMTSNDALRDAVMEQIRSDQAIAARDVVVNAGNNLVTLAGFVATYAEKYAAEKAAQSVHGVSAIANDIIVKPLGGHTDPEIARDIIHAMKMNASIPDDKVTVIVTDGIVRLNGTVESDCERRAAEACVRNIAGVVGIMNTLALEVRARRAEMRQMPQAG